MGSEIAVLYNLLNFYKRTVVETLNKIDANLVDVVNDYNNSQTTNSSSKKYEIASHMTGMLPHYVQMLQTAEVMAAELLVQLNKVGCDLHPEKDLDFSNPFYTPELQEQQEPEVNNSFQQIEQDLEELEISEMVHPKIELQPTEKSFFESSDQSEEEIIVGNTDIKDERTENSESVQLESRTLEVGLDIKDESGEPLPRIENTNCDVESVFKPEVVLSEIDHKHKINQSESSNFNCQVASQTELVPKTDLKTENNDNVCTEIPVDQPQEKSPRKRKSSKKNKKSNTNPSSPQSDTVKDNIQVEESPKTSPAVHRVPVKQPYNWREEAVKRLINENLKTTLTWRVSPSQNKTKRESEGRSKGNGPIFEIPAEQLSIGEICVFTHIESPSEFYILTNQVLLNSLENSLNEDMNKQQYVINKYKSKELAKNSLGKFCTAFFSDTRRWHRVKILNWMDDEPETILVQLIDYGEKSHLSYKNVKNMAELYATIPKMATKCHFAGIYSAHAQLTKWSTASVDFFVKLSEIRKRTEFVVAFARREGNSYGVDLRKENDPEGDTLGQILVKSGYACGRELTNHLETIAEEHSVEELKREEEVSTEKILQCQSFTKVVLPAVGEYVDILITGYVNTCHFYAHVLSERGSNLYNHDFEQLHHHLKMNNVVESYESFKVSPRKGEVVLVKEKQDWFRGLCKEGDADNEFDIFLVDFGYSVTKKLTDIRQIKEDFLKVPFQAVECILDNCQERKGVVADVSKNFFQNVMNMQIFQGLVLGSGEPLRVQIWDSNDMDMTHVLKRWSLGEDRDEH